MIATKTSQRPLSHTPFTAPSRRAAKSGRLGIYACGGGLLC